MFIFYYTYIPRPFHAVDRALLEKADGWLPGLVKGAIERGEALRTTVGVGGGALHAAKQIEIQLGEPLRHSALTLVPLVAEATGPRPLFPKLEADLGLAPMGPAVTQITLRGIYRPPLGAVGDVIDHTLLHRVAEAALKDLVDQISAALERLVDQPAPV